MGKRSVILTESQLHNLIKEAVNSVLLNESIELPEVLYCKSSERNFEGHGEIRYAVVCEYRKNGSPYFASGYFNMDRYGRLLWNSEFISAPYDIENRTVDGNGREKLSSEESEAICQEIIRTGQTSNYRSHELNSISGLKYIMPY